MIPLAAALAAGLLAAAPAVAPAIPGQGAVSASADSTTVDTQTGTVRLAGNVVIRRGLVTLRADAATYDRQTGEVVAAGNVLLVDPTRVVAADGIRVILDDGWQADHVVAFLKEGPSPIGNAVTLDEARRGGRNRASFSGSRLAADGSGRLELDDAEVTLCDCGGGAPSWKLRTRRADVIPGKRALLSWPVLYVTPRFLGVNHPVAIPLLRLPVVYVPLSDRQTGLLFPAIASTTATGLGIGEPLFVTLGRSWDLTVTPHYFFGPGSGAIARADPAVRGPGAELELRWAPAPGAEGHLEARYVHDEDREPWGAWGDRLQLGGRHVQPLGDSGRLLADVALSSDPVWFRDFTSDLLLRSAFYARSSVVASRSFDAAVVEGSAAYHEALAPSTVFSPGRMPGVAYGAFSSDLPVFQRWPSLSVDVLPERVGPLVASGRVGLSRYAPLHGEVSDSGVDGLGPGDRGWPGGTTDPGAGNGRWDVHERLAATRADARVELGAPLALAGGAVRLDPYLRGAAAAYHYDTALGDDATAWSVFGAAASVELTRTYGAFEHRLIPRVEYRGGTGAAGSPPEIPAFDLWDRVRNDPTVTVGGVAYGPVRYLTAAPDGPFHQARLSVDNRLTRPGLALRLELGQDADLRAGRFAESFVTASVASGPFALDGTARFLLLQGRAQPAPPPLASSWLDKLTEVRVGFLARDPRGDNLHAGLVAVGQGGSGTAVAGVDPLFDLRPARVDAVAQGSAGARVVLGGATLGYDALVPGRPTEIARCSAGGGTRLSAPLEIQQHTLSFGWNSPCRCFDLRAVIHVDPCGNVSLSQVSIDLSRLGQQATVR